MFCIIKDTRQKRSTTRRKSGKYVVKKIGVITGHSLQSILKKIQKEKSPGIAIGSETLILTATGTANYRHWNTVHKIIKYSVLTSIGRGSGTISSSIRSIRLVTVVIRSVKLRSATCPLRKGLINTGSGAPEMPRGGSSSPLKDSAWVSSRSLRQQGSMASIVSDHPRHLLLNLLCKYQYLVSLIPNLQKISVFCMHMYFYIYI